MMNEPEVDGMRQEDYSKDCMGYAYRKERFVILREEDDGGRVMVMSDDERVRPGD